MPNLEHFEKQSKIKDPWERLEIKRDFSLGNLFASHGKILINILKEDNDLTKDSPIFTPFHAALALILIEHVNAELAFEEISLSINKKLRYNPLISDLLRTLPTESTWSIYETRNTLNNFVFIKTYLERIGRNDLNDLPIDPTAIKIFARNIWPIAGDLNITNEEETRKLLINLGVSTQYLEIILTRDFAKKLLKEGQFEQSELLRNYSADTKEGTALALKVALRNPTIDKFSQILNRISTLVSIAKGTQDNVVIDYSKIQDSLTVFLNALFEKSTDKPTLNSKIFEKFSEQGLELLEIEISNTFARAMSPFFKHESILGNREFDLISKTKQFLDAIFKYKCDGHASLSYVSYVKFLGLPIVKQIAGERLIKEAAIIGVIDRVLSTQIKIKEKYDKNGITLLNKTAKEFGLWYKF